MISDDSIPNDEITDEVDEGFVDESTMLLSSSISEKLLTVGVGTTEEEEEEDEDEKDEVCPIHI